MSNLTLFFKEWYSNVLKTRNIEGKRDRMELLETVYYKPCPSTYFKLISNKLVRNVISSLQGESLSLYPSIYSFVYQDIKHKFNQH